MGKLNRGRGRPLAWSLFMGVLLVALPALASGTPGDLDLGFGTDGLAYADWETTSSVALGVQSDGKVVMAAYDVAPPVDGQSRARWRVRRLTTGGVLDTDFGSSGETQLFGDHGSDIVWDMAIDSSDRVLITGRVTVAETTTSGRGKKQTTSTVYRTLLTIVRLTSDGALDTSFGADGVAQTDLAGAGIAIAIEPDGDIVVAGDVSVTSASSGGGGKKKRGGGGSTSSSAICVLRYDSSGELDTSFGTNGVTVDDLTSNNDTVFQGAIGFQGSGHVVVGSRISGSSEQWVLTRYDSNGSKDTNFGRVSIDGQYLYALAIDSSDRILACGYSVVDGSAIVGRHAASGEVDTGFGTNGLAELSVGDVSGGSGLALQSDGKIVTSVVFQDGVTGEWELLITRLDSAGDADLGYGVLGFGDASGVAGSSISALSPLVLDGNGNAISAGFTQYASGDFAVFIGRWCGD